MEPTAISAVTPITTPSTVRNERDLCSRSVWNAMRAFSPISKRGRLNLLCSPFMA